MSKKSDDRKRKKKLAEKKQKARQKQSLAYMGEKYKKDALIPSWLHAELGIYRTYIVTNRKITDQTVEAGIERLIRQMRAGSLPPLPEEAEAGHEAGAEEDLLIENIRRSWEAHFATAWRPSRDDQIGVLRSILGSIKKVKAPGRSQSYLQHIAGFLTKQLGISATGLTADRKPLPEPEEDALIQLGEQWSRDGDREARAEFFELASQLLRKGEASRVIDACHFLVGGISDPSSEMVAELLDLIRQARRSIIAKLG